MKGQEHIRGSLGGVLYRQGVKGIFQISYMNNGREVRESTHTTDQQKAAAILEARIREVSLSKETGIPYERPGNITVTKALERYEISRKLKGQWNDTFKCDVKYLRQKFGFFQCRAITKEQLQDWFLQCKQGLDEKKSLATNCTLNRRIAILFKAMKICDVFHFKKEDIQELRLPEPEPRQGIFSADEVEILLKNLPEYASHVIEALWLTGWRLSEVAGCKKLGQFKPGLCWSEMREGALLIPGSRVKNRRAKYIPLSGQLLDLIERRKNLRIPGCDLIFHKDGQPVGEFRAKWQSACEKVGKPNGLIHDLRRSRARVWNMAGISERTAMILGGWQSNEIFRRYQIVSDDDMKHAINKAEEYLKLQKKK